jgi:DNA helicase HerA-like ATPase
MPEPSVEPPAPPAGLVIGTEDATPLEFWVGVAPGSYLQLDDVVALERRLPTGERVDIYGVVTQVRARHEGARYDSDVFLIADGVMPGEVSEAALVMATRFEPEIFVPPHPGEPVRKAVGAEREKALYLDGMRKTLPVGHSRDY